MLCHDVKEWLITQEKSHSAFPLIRAGVSTAQIMRAIHEQRTAAKQFEEIHRQQCKRIQRLRTVGAIGLGISLFLLSSIPLVFFALLIIESTFSAKVLAWLGGIIDIFIILAQYLQEDLTLLTSNSWFLSGMALAVVVMMGMWLYLMRFPQVGS